MMALWTQSELREALGADPSALLNGSVAGVSIDTRTLQVGDLFFAIKGDGRDGHDFVARALEAGAAAAVVNRGRAPSLADCGPVYPTDDPMNAMERLGVASRSRSKARIAAVTGSVGKTTAKEMLSALLSACGPTHASRASYNNHWGVPLTLARMPANAEFGIFEIGMNHAGEIGPLVQMVRPHVAFITTIAPVHIEHLGSIEAIADAKAEIFLGLEPEGTAVLNRDAAQFERLARAALARRARTLTFGASEDCDARIVEAIDTERGSLIHARFLGRDMRFDLGAPGLHMAQNAVGALLAAHALGADVDRCAATLADFSAQKGRGERISIPTLDGSVTIIDESYNANPASMRAALALLGAARPGPNGRRIAVIGDMLELGADGAAIHAQLVDDLRSNGVDLLFGAGPLTRALFDAAPASMRAAWTEQSSELTTKIARALRSGDVAMIKGSNASRMGPLLESLRERLAHAQDEDAQC